MFFTPKAVSKRLKDKPFIPLRIITSSGESYDIFHPEIVLVGASFLIVGTPGLNDPEYFEHVTRIALAHVTELRDLPSPAKVAMNGEE